MELRESFEAFGGRRGSAWSGVPSSAQLATMRGVTRRGYTGHGHLDSTALMHLNGRVYDPALGRFVSADRLIDGALNTQGWNAYAYVKNNPLSFTDPTGFSRSWPTTRVLPIDPHSGLETITVEASRLYDNPIGPMFGFGSGGLQGSEGGPRELEEVVVTGRRSRRLPEPPEAPEPSEAPLQERQVKNRLCRAGNSVANWSDGLGNVSGTLELSGLGIAGVGFVTGQPGVAAPGLALAATGGAGNIGAGVLQFTAGLLQGTGGGGFANSSYAALSLATGFTLARGITGPPAGGYRTVSQRTGDAFANGTATIAGGVNGLWTSLVDAATPQQVNCPGGN